SSSSLALSGYGPFIILLLSSTSFHLRDLHSFPTRRSSDLVTFSFTISSSCDSASCVIKPSRNNLLAYFIDSIYSSFAKSEVNSRSEEHTSELQSRFDLVCRLLLEKKKIITKLIMYGESHV